MKNSNSNWFVLNNKYNLRILHHSWCSASNKSTKKASYIKLTQGVAYCIKLTQGFPHQKKLFSTCQQLITCIYGNFFPYLVPSFTNFVFIFMSITSFFTPRNTKAINSEPTPQCSPLLLESLGSTIVIPTMQVTPLQSQDKGSNKDNLRLSQS